jgi:hypothetical protein
MIKRTVTLLLVSLIINMSTLHVAIASNEVDDLLKQSGSTASAQAPVSELSPLTGVPTQRSTDVVINMPFSHYPNRVFDCLMHRDRPIFDDSNGCGITVKGVVLVTIGLVSAGAIGLGCAFAVAWLQSVFPPAGNFTFIGPG